METAVRHTSQQRQPQPNVPVAEPMTNPMPKLPEQSSDTPSKSKKPSKTASGASIEQARRAKAEKDTLQKGEALTLLLRYVNDNPDASFSDIGQVIDRSKTTVSNYVRELEANGRLQRNGEGWEVLT